MGQSSDAARNDPERGDPHRREHPIADLILGGQDGLVNVLGVLLGVAAATSDPKVVLVAGLAATFAESVSMAAVAYTSTEAQRRVFESERSREQRHVRRGPELERDEVRELYARKGFSGELLDRIVEKITADPEVWVAVMLAEELRLSPIEPRKSLRSAGVVGASALVGSLVPLVPFLFLRAGPASVASVAVAAGALFAVGVYKAKVTVGGPLRSGLELAAIGTLSALVGYAVGAVFKV